MPTPERPSPKQIIEGITVNTTEIIVQIEAAISSPANAELFMGGIQDVLAGKFARRIYLAAKSGIDEQEVISAIKGAFTNKTED